MGLLSFLLGRTEAFLSAARVLPSHLHRSSLLSSTTSAATSSSTKNNSDSSSNQDLLESPLDVSNQLFTAIIIFDVANTQEQDELIAAIQDFVHQDVKNQPGFVSANLHKSLDGTKVVNYAQWKTREDFDAFRNNDHVQSGDRLQVLFQFGPPESKTYDIFAFACKETAVDGLTTLDPRVHAGPFVHVAEFDMVSVDLQPTMVDLARTHLEPAVHTPGLLSATFHRSHDGAKVINYGQWENMEAIENLKKQPGFSATDQASPPYWDGVAVNQHHLYELVKIIHATLNASAVCQTMPETNFLPPSRSWMFNSSMFTQTQQLDIVEPNLPFSLSVEVVPIFVVQSLYLRRNLLYHKEYNAVLTPE